MAWVEQRGTRYRVRFRQPVGAVGTDSSHPTRAAADLRCKQVDIDQADSSVVRQRRSARRRRLNRAAAHPGVCPAEHPAGHTQLGAIRGEAHATAPRPVLLDLTSGGVGHDSGDCNTATEKEP